MRIFLLTVMICLKVLRAEAQCNGIDVAVPDEVCLKSNFLVENNSTPASFEWDLCPFDLTASPSLLKVVNTGLSSTIDFTLAEDNSLFYGFAVDANSNSLLRVDFGNSRDNIPTTTNLGNVSALFQFPNSISIVHQGDSWLGILANGGNEKIILLNFGASLSNTPIATVLHTRSGGGFANIAVASTSGEGHALVIAEFNTRQVSILNYAQGFLMDPDAEQIISLPGSTPIDVQLIKQCDDWKALVLSFDNHKLYKLDFGNSFVDPPAVSEYGVTLGFEPYRLSLAREGESFYGFVSSTSGGLNRLDFENDIDNNPTVAALGTFGVLSNSRSLQIDTYEGHWRAFMINFSDGDLFRFSFLKNCGAFPSYATGPTPGYVHYTVAGEQEIAVTAFEADGTVSTFAYPLTVANLTAPEFTIQQTNACVNHEVYFQPENVHGAITSYQWDFGDGNTSSLQNPSHVYSSTNTFPVSLLVFGDNSCSNKKQIGVTIFEKPVSQFLLPAIAPVCTNQMLEFINTSDFNVDSDPYWRWFVNSIEVSVEKDLTIALNTPGPHSIKLIAGIPGCETESEEGLGPLIEGPKVDFEYTGICLGDGTSFLNTSSGDIDGLEWDFGDGNTSTNENPTNIFSEFGEYEVSLTASSAIGCQNRKTKIINIRSKPIPDFETAHPPYSCNGMPTQFINNTVNPDGDNISGWLWDFNDETNPVLQTEENPDHIFAAAGDHMIFLTVTTESGCAATMEKEISITQSPSPDFTYSPACHRVPVTFTATSPGIDDWYWEMGTAYYTTASPSHTFKTPGDFPVHLAVRSNNGCTASIDIVIHVPAPLNPDFSVIRNCVGEETILTDITTGQDSVMSRQWDVNTGEVLTASPVMFTFHSQGNATIGLNVITQSGCTYQKTRQIEILSPPQATFSANPASGGYPLKVEFTNTSELATRYLWKFNDGTGATSAEISPVYTFQGLGSFTVELTAYNEQLCQHTSHSIISTAAPLIDADVEMIALLPNTDGSSRLIVTIHNKGNKLLKDLPVDIDFGGGLKLRQIVGEPIFPASKYNLVLNTGILNASSLRYLCASLDLENDLTPAGNRKCIEFGNTLHVFPAYPNPTTGVLNLEWIAEDTGPVSISIVDALGREMVQIESAGVQGLNHRIIDLNSRPNGIYYLFLEAGNTKKSQRILVSGKP
ncbi:MAG: PKD domain-containing protein [Cyclobacteriaceae bacterium]